MRFLSLFSGIECVSVAWEPLGWECVGVAEIDPFASAVLAHRYPSVPNLGDVRGIDSAAVTALGKVDLVVFGFPCQDLSVAGRREGLRKHDGTTTRSGLFFEAMRIVRLASPRWAVAENVPGLLSSHGGRDFAAVVGEMAGCEFDMPDAGWGNAGVAAGPGGLVEWATLDAQFFGVAQRRARVFLVLDTGDWSCRGPVLLEREGLRGDPAPSREAGEGAAGTVKAGTPKGDRGSDVDALAPALRTNAWNNSDPGMEAQMLVAHTLKAEGADASEDDENLVVGFHARQDPIHGPQSMPLEAKGGQAVMARSAVRRFTPRECERLQGLPDDWTLVPYRGKPGKDGPRYRAIGNGMAVPVLRWIGERIALWESIGSGSIRKRPPRGRHDV